MVIDTSVAIKWFIPEEGSEAAKALLAEELVAPDLLLYELANYLNAQKGLGLEDRHFILSLLYQFSIEFFVLPEKGFEEILSLCDRYGITAYDASFIALAKRLKTDFITADKRLKQKTGDLPFVRLLVP